MPINCKMYLVSACVERACLSNLIAVLCWLNSAKPTPRPLTLSVPFRSHQLSCWRPLLNVSGRLRGLLLKEPLVSKPTVISELSIKNKQERSLKNGAQWRSTRSSITGWTLDEYPGGEKGCLWGNRIIESFPFYDDLAMIKLQLMKSCSGSPDTSLPPLTVVSWPWSWWLRLRWYCWPGNSSHSIVKSVWSKLGLLYLSST